MASHAKERRGECVNKKREKKWQTRKNK